MTPRLGGVRLAAAGALAATALAVPSMSAGAHPPGPGVVRVDSGWLRGSVAEDHVTYSAIPYAAPPVGERRWRPPTSPRRWSGVRDATTPSPYCPQSAPENPENPEGVVGQEDCLYLDVTTPRDARQERRLPVLVWLHGGGLTSGGAREQDGARISVAGDMVVVDINYRLGALGFLTTPELGDGNYGLMDQAAALRWVRRNIARFGGDPRNVTLAGQSGGARSVCAQLASPFSWGLFDRAISQSGACDNPVPTRSAAREFGASATEELGCATADDVAGCLRERSPARLVGTLAGVGFSLTGRAADRPWNPVAGTWMLPWQPGWAMRHGLAARVPLLVGSTRDEMRSFVSGAAALPDEQYRTMMTDTFGDAAGIVLDAYPVTAYRSPALALATVLTDWGANIGACPVLRTAAAAADRQPVYAYEFAEDSRQVTDQDFPLGAYHGLDLPYLWDLDLLWGNPHPELTPEQERFSATMIDYWSAFSRAGDPNGPGRPHWPEFGTSGTVIGFSTEGIAPTPYAVEHRCDLWANLPR